MQADVGSTPTTVGEYSGAGGSGNARSVACAGVANPLISDVNSGGQGQALLRSPRRAGFRALLILAVFLGFYPYSGVAAPDACAGMPSACGNSDSELDDALCEFWEQLGCLKDRSGATSEDGSGASDQSGGGGGESGTASETTSGATAPDACAGMPSACGNSGNELDDALCEFWEQLGCLKDRSSSASENASGASGQSGESGGANGTASGTSGAPRAQGASGIANESASGASDDSESSTAVSLGGSAATQIASPEEAPKKTGDAYLDFLRAELARETDPNKKQALLDEIEKYTSQ